MKKMFEGGGTRARTGSRVVSYLLAGSVFSILFMFPNVAHAQHWKRISGHTCVVNAKNAPGGVYKTEGGNLLVCPFDDSDVFRKQDINVLNVHGFTTGDSIGVWVCSRSWNSYYVARCTQAKRSGPGEFSVSFSRDDLSAAWGPIYAAEFAYILVETDATSQHAAVYGIFASQ
jgi:hypothetical protein